jgi:release factor glutamine methyltransferase
MDRQIADLLFEGTESLKNFSDTPKLDAEILLSEVLRINRNNLFLSSNLQVSESDIKKYKDFLKRRKIHEPVAYIIEKKEFYEDTFFVDSRVLVPRPETEILVDEAVKLYREKNIKLLDICCGSGCIGLSIKRKVNCELTLSDISNQALDVAKINAFKLFDNNANIKFVKSDLFENVTGKYDLITANPPYLSEKDMEIYCKNGLKFEPEEALLSGSTGFEITEKIIEQSSEYLNINGMLVLELGFEGSPFLKDTDKLKLKKVLKDLAGIDRVAVFILHR